MSRSRPRSLLLSLLPHRSLFVSESPFPPETRVVNAEKGAQFDVYIGRSGPWGNPYYLGPREENIEKYRLLLQDWVRKNGWEAVYALESLYGATLGCHCAPLPCHGDVLVRAASWAHNAVLNHEGAPGIVFHGWLPVSEEHLADARA